jgi:hypothetical protein
MNRWKSTLTCSYCSKIFHDPIELPCSHNLCKSHLIVKKENKIECIECKKEFQINDNDFKSNTFIRKQIDDHVYLNVKGQGSRLGYLYGNDRQDKEVRGHVFDKSRR